MAKCNCLTTVQKKFWTGVTGLMLVGFIFAHLSGNLLIFKGADALNNYAAFLKGLGPLLWAARIGLIAAFVAHIALIVSLVIDAKKARPENYAVDKDQVKLTNTLGVKTMRISGSIIFLYLIVHLLDFTFADHHGTQSLINGVDQGLYGLVVNTLSQPLHAAWYIIAMIALGLHLSHSLQSVCQTFGFLNSNYRKQISLVSSIIGLGVAATYASIPVYILTSL